MSLHLLVAAEAAEKTRHLPANPYVFGAIALGILTILMLGLLAFGRGREHS